VSRYGPPDAQNTATADELLAAASQIATYLEDVARESDGLLYWSYLTPHLGRWTRAHTAWDLYDGLAGIALYFAFYASIVGDVARATFAGRILDSARRLFWADVASRRDALPPGASIGIGGWLYTLCQCAALWKCDDLVSEAEDIIPLAEHSLDQAVESDWSVGVAGLLSAALVWHAHRPSGSFASLVDRCAAKLVEQSAQIDQVVVWPSLLPSTAPLAGAAHGAAGIISPLLAAGTLTGCSRYTQMAHLGARYEDSVFCRSAKNWPDFRFLEWRPDGTRLRVREPVYSALWCWGAAGIGMMRLSCLSLTPDQKYRTDVDNALAATLALGFGRNHSLCHGDLGNLDLFVLASEVLSRPDLLVTARRIASLPLACSSIDGWLCGNPFWAESPGLMTGLAGIGYGLLRVACPALVPSVLTFGPPRAKSINQEICNENNSSHHGLSGRCTY
jgi:lantibiotic modifying enzyme